MAENAWKCHSRQVIGTEDEHPYVRTASCDTEFDGKCLGERNLEVSIAMGAPQMLDGL